MEDRIPNSFFPIISLLFLTNSALSFNFDTNYPIVYVDPYNVSTTQATKSSYFGYSVLLYEGKDRNQPWIQIGAPRGSNPLAHDMNTGVVFRCGIKSTCYLINMKPSTNSDTYTDEAYFGNSMDISEDKTIFATCGHRWVEISPSNDYYMEGACFAGRTNENNTDFINSLYKKNDPTITVSQVRVYNLALAQMGFSAQFVKGDKNDLLVGLPGLLNWKGAAGMLVKADRPAPARRRKRSTDDLRDSIIPDITHTNEIKYFDLAGYSVTSGRFYDTTTLYYVAGAPRASLKGSVLIFNFSDRRTILKKEIKESKHVGEYFGSSVTASDINGDTLDDLIVGAPFRKGDSSESKFDRGAIYYYFGSKNGLEEDAANTISGKIDGGRFGEAVMSLGDIDKDGFADIAVSAPYDNDNSGVVYIFRGSRSGLIKEPAQIIKGKDIIPNVRGFGISLSKPADVDGNKYSDLAIGAYHSGHAVLLRGKPVIALEHRLTSSVNQISAANLVNSFNITSCVSYNGKDIENIKEVEVVRALSVDKGISDRAYLEDTSKLGSKLIVRGQEYCEIYVVKIKTNPQNIYDPIVIRGSVDVVKRPETKQVITVTDKVDGNDEFCSNCAILRSVAETDKQINVDINRECGSDNVCDSVLELSAKFENWNDIYFIGAKEYITLSTTVTNTAENAFQTEIFITLPREVRLKRIPPNCKETSSEISCTIDNPLKKDASKTVSLELDLDEVNTGKYTDDLKFLLEVKTSSKNEGDQQKELSLKLIKKADLELKGASGEETYSYINRTYGRAIFQQVYKLIKYDISPIQMAKLTVNIPTSLRIENNEVKFLSLYAPEGSLAGQPVNCYSNLNTIMDPNVPVIVGDADKKKRKRRDVAIVEEQLAKYPSNRTIYFNCSAESTESGVVCGSVTCDIGPFKNVKNIAEVRFKMVLDISGLKDYKPDKDIVIVSTSGKVEIADEVSNSDSYRHEILVPSVFIGPSVEQSIAIWIIIVAIICGILLLAIVAGALYKLGFFKRTKKALLMEEKAKKNAVRSSSL